MSGITARRTAALPVVALLLGGITLLGLGVRVLGIDAASFWVDEAFTGDWIRHGHGFLWTEGLILETTPALYYSLLKLWAGAFGEDDRALRLFSAFASAATIPLVHALARQVAAVPVALLAALLFALAPMQVAYAQEARAYALLPLAYALAALGLLGFLRAARAGRAAGGGLALYAAAAVGLIYLHATSVFTIAACGLLALWLLLARPAARRRVPAFLLANAAIALLAVPELRAILAQSGRHDMAWIDPPGRVGLLNLATNLMIDPVTPLRAFRASVILAGLALLLLAATLAFVRVAADPAGSAPAEHRLDPAGVAVLAGVPALFLGAAIGLSFLSPFLIPRIIIWFGVPLAILAALALLAPAPRLLRGALGLALLACIGAGLHGVYRLTPAEKEDWRGTLAAVLAELGPEDVVVLGPDTSAMPLLRYAGPVFAGGGRVVHRWQPAPRPPDIYTPEGIGPLVPLDTPGLAAAIAGPRPVWLLLRRSDWERHRDAAPAGVPDRRHPGVIVLRWPPRPRRPHHRPHHRAPHRPHDRPLAGGARPHRSAAPSSRRRPAPGTPR